MTRPVFSPGDIFLTYLGGSLWDLILRWVLGSPYGHVFMYWTDIVNTGLDSGIIVEAIDRGVTARPLMSYEGVHVRVLKPRLSSAGLKASAAVSKILAEPDAYYDYLAIARMVLPRLVAQKLGIPLPLRWHKNRYYICSELVATAYLRAGYDLVPNDVVPLPGDFDTSPRLSMVWDGVL